MDALVFLKPECPYCKSIGKATIEESKIKLASKFYEIICGTCDSDYLLEVRAQVEIFSTKTQIPPGVEKKLKTPMYRRK